MVMVCAPIDMQKACSKKLQELENQAQEVSREQQEHGDADEDQNRIAQYTRIIMECQVEENNCEVRARRAWAYQA